MIKTIQLIIFAFIVANPAFAQDHVELMSKYKNYKKQLNQNFVRVGMNSGESIVASIHTNESISWRDNGVPQQGWYIATLATEVELLRLNEQSSQTAIEELYYALLALKRLDLAAEKYFGGDEIENGFLIKDDIFENSSQLFPNQIVLSNSNTQERQNNEQGLSSMVDILFGLALVKRFIPREIKFNDQSLLEIAELMTLNYYHFLVKHQFRPINPILNRKIIDSEETKMFAQLITYSATYILGRNHPVFNELHYSWPSYFYSRFSKLGLIAKNKNRNLILQLASIGTGWGNNVRARLKWYERLYNKSIFHLVYKVINEEFTLWENRELQTILDLLATAPQEGPNFKNRTGWSEINRFLSKSLDYNTQTRRYARRTPQISESEHYPGLDFMLLHNLYQIQRTHLQNLTSSNL